MLLRDPVFVPESGTTYERSAIVAFWQSSVGNRRDPVSNAEIASEVLYTNWDKRREVAAWLADHPTYVPQGWRSRDDIPPANAHLEATNEAHRGALFFNGLRRNRYAALGGGDALDGGGALNFTRQCFAMVVIVAALGLGFGVESLLLGTYSQPEPDLLHKPAERTCHGHQPDLFDSQPSSLRRLLGDSHMPYGPPPGSRLVVGVLRRRSQDSAVAEGGLRLVEGSVEGNVEGGVEGSVEGSVEGGVDGIYIDLPRTSLIGAFSGQLAMGIVFTGTTGCAANLHHTQGPQLRQSVIRKQLSPFAPP